MYRRLAKDSAVYTGSAVLTRGLSFILLPVYVRLLPKEEFGLFDYLLALGALVGVVVSLEVAQGMMRYVAEFQGDGPAQGLLIANTVWTTVGCYTAFVIVVATVRDWLASIILGDAALAGILVVSAGLYMSMALVYLWTAVGRALLRPLAAVAFSLSSAILSGAFGVIFVVKGGGTAQNLISGMALGQSLVAIAGFVVFRHLVFRFPEVSALHQLLKFSLPLVASSLSFTASLYIDRFVVMHYLGLDDLAVYGVGARVAAVMSLLVVGLQSALTPLVYSEIGDTQTRVRLGVLFRWYVAAGITTISGLWLASDLIVQIVAGPGYAAAGGVIVLLSLAALVQSAYLFFPGLYVAGRTTTLAVIHVVGVGVNAILSIWLVNVVGVTGVAFATLLASAVIAVLNYRIAQRHFAVPVLGGVAG